MAPEKGNLFERSLLREIRERFCHVESAPASGPRVYLENAGGSLTLKKVVEVVAEQTALPDNAGRANPTSRAIDALIAKGREDLRTLLGAQAGTVFVGESTTSIAFQVLGAIIRGVPGKNVVTTNLDHPAVYDSTRFLSERFGKEWRCAELCPRTGRVEWESVARQIDSSTSVLAIIHSSNITGARSEVASIIRAARKIRPDLYVVVDGAQHGSHGFVDVEQLGCDAYFLSSYKSFSKIGASAAYLSDRAARLPHDRLLGKPETSWEMGTREQAGYAGWSAVIDYLSWLGSHFTAASTRREQMVAAMNAIELHERSLTFRVLHGLNGASGLLDMPHVVVYGETSALELREPCITFNVKGMTSAAVVSYLGENGIWAHNRVSDAYSRHTLQALGIEECVRVSLAHYNSPAEVETLLGALAKVAS